MKDKNRREQLREILQRELAELDSRIVNLPASTAHDELYQQTIERAVLLRGMLQKLG
jgi:hypothetical protein